MNDQPHPLPATPKRKRATTLRGTRIIDPGVAEIRKRASAEIREYHKAQSSEKLLKAILDKRLAQLTMADKEKLFDFLKAVVTPALPMLDS